MNGAQWSGTCFADTGVDTVFGYPGGAIMPVYDALYDGGVEHLLCRHEQRGQPWRPLVMHEQPVKPGCVSRRPAGATNLITGLADAYLDSIPIVAITGGESAPSSARMRSREVDVLGLSLACLKAQFPCAVSGRTAAGYCRGFPGGWKLRPSRSGAG
ncbi:thiamine pyrophosphate-binding protein [Klebsiella pneumoniae]|uniref:thiamine pyrophosphate-binding protein n=1 Tax=Klebsiella pneumoniae TaxID=573 RepID=UPI00388D3BC9